MCPFCGSSKQKLFINNDLLDSHYGQWICFNCGESGNLISFLMKGLHISFSQASQMVADSGVSLQQKAFNQELSNNENIMIAISSQRRLADIEEPLDRVEIPHKPAPPLPFGLKYFKDHINDPEAQPFFNYLASRGFSRQLVTQLGYGYIIDGYAKTENGTIPIHNHVVFFTYDDAGRYQYWNTRAIGIVGPHESKSINAPNTKTNDYLGKGDLIYNDSTAFKQKFVVLTEGVPDALTLYPFGVATFGKQITDFQKAILVQKMRPEQTLFVMLDMDASYLLIQTAKEIAEYHENTYMVFNYTRRDANSLGRDRAFDVIRKGALPVTQLGMVRFNLLMGQM